MNYGTLCLDYLLSNIKRRIVDTCHNMSESKIIISNERILDEKDTIVFVAI